MNERDWSLDAEARPRPLILARRLWRALRIVGHLIAGVAEAAWRRAAPWMSPVSSGVWSKTPIW